MGPRDVYDLPRLEEVVSGDTLLSPIPHTPGVSHTPPLAIVESAPTEVSQDSFPRTKRIGAPRLQDPGSEPTRMEATAEVPRSRSSKVVGIIALLLLASGALGFWLTRANSVDPAQAAASSEPVPAESATVSEPIVTPSSAEPVVEEPSPEPSASAAPSAAPAVMPPAPAPRPVKRPVAAAPKPAPAAKPAPNPAPKPAPKSGSPVFEQNPYGLH
jgi:hypothetical protein